MQLADEQIEYHFQAMVAAPSAEAWGVVQEAQAKYLLAPARLRAFLPAVTQVRGQIAAERELQNPPPELKPLDAGFIDYPQKLLDSYRRKADQSELGRVLNLAARLRDQVDRVVMLGIGGPVAGAKAIFQALKHTYHNELPAKTRLGTPRLYFEGDNADNDATSDLIDFIENTALDPEIAEERWGLIVVSKSGEAIEPAVAYRLFHKEFARFYGPSSPRTKQLVVPVTAATSKLRDLCKAQGIAEDDILPWPDNIGARYSVFTAAGLLPAAVLGLDVRAMLLGAAAMTRRFLDEPFERNPVLQYATVNYLMTEERGQTTRVLAVWSKKLEALGQWHDHLVAESLGKQGRGPKPLTAVMSRDLYARGQQLQEGPRDTAVNNVVVKTPRATTYGVSMADRNEDDLNQLNRRSLTDILKSALTGANQAYADAVRPTADILVPSLNEFALGQLMQMFMLATVVEARLMGVNPYGEPGAEVYRKNMRAVLKAMPNPT